MRPENLWVFEPALAVTANAPKRLYSLQAFFFLFLRVCLTHFLPAFRPAPTLSIANKTRDASLSLKVNVVPFGAALALTADSAVPFLSTANFDGEAFGGALNV